MRSKFSTTESGTGGLPETVLVGTILRPHGIQGEVTVALWSDNERRFAPGVEFQATSSFRACGGGSGPRPAVRSALLRIERCSPYKGGLRIAFAGIADREAAESLRGLELRVPLADVPDAPAGSVLRLRAHRLPLLSTRATGMSARSSTFTRTAAAPCSRWRRTAGDR